MPDSNNTHPGEYVRTHVIPRGMSVTDAARTIGVSRPALSNLLNGRAGLSRQMAARLARAFGADPENLIERQAAYESAHGHEKRSIVMETSKHVPPFLRATANQIEEWSEKLEARGLLAVLLRTLVNSTCGGLRLVDFPGRDDSQRPGWDGCVVTDEGNQWVPEGVSGWEFGTNRNITQKADTDYEKRTDVVAETERKKTAFVFVTPRRWSKKDNWAKDRAAEGQWRSVRALDASDLEQWLEQSIAAQACFTRFLGLNLRGVKSLDRCWDEWCADCDPPFSKQIFEQAKSAHGGQVLDHLNSDHGGLLRIVADSRQEGLAFLSALLTQGTPEFEKLRDRIVVFSDQGPLSELAVGSPGFIPVVTSASVEKELAQSGCELTSVVVEHRTAVVSDSSIVLNTLSYPAFEEGLTSMGLGREKIQRLDRECGRSLTVLRRCLAKSEALRSPSWSADEDLARFLVPMMLAGAWASDRDDDSFVMAQLAGFESYDAMETPFNRLLGLEDSPVWCERGFRGVVSKIDVLFGMRHWVTENQIDRFIEMAELLLSEPDPALDLAEKDRWAAPMYGKEREFSSPLRNGVAESLVLLSIHGDRLFGTRFRRSLESRIRDLVRNLLEPLTQENLLSQTSNFALYAEAAPEVFLEILEYDLLREEPTVAALMRPTAASLFHPRGRADLLWALELLAWRSDWLARVVELLAQLAMLEPNDNLANRPSESLQAIFRSWLPQTAAPVEQRIAILDSLVKQYPTIAWRIAISQFEPTLWIGSYANKPKWRDYALGAGEPVTSGERDRFSVHCVKTCLGWRSHTRETLADLLMSAERLGFEDLKQLEKRVAEWAESAKDPDRAWLRERLRVSMRLETCRTSKPTQKDASTNARIRAARRIFDNLEPADLVWKHAWLFKEPWIKESWDDVHEDRGFEAHEDRIRKLRREAVQQVAVEVGHKGIIDLALSGNAADRVGWSLAESGSDDQALLNFIRAVMEDGDILKSASHQSLISGVLQCVEQECAVSFVRLLCEECGTDVGIQLLSLCRFDRPAWSQADELGEDVAARFWSSVQPSWRNHNSEELNFAVSRLLQAGRPMAALEFGRADWGRVQSMHIRDVLGSLPASDELAGRVIDAYAIQQALKVLNERNAFSQAELARLEYLYLDLFWPDDDAKLPNLERELEANPELFCKAVALAFRREGEDAREKVSEEEHGAAKRALKLLQMLKCVPGRDADGTLRTDRLTAWVRNAQDMCRISGHQKLGDQQIGGLLARTPTGSDGIWPCVAVRETLEGVLNDDISVGLEVGRRNLRGAHIRAVGGAQERELATQYREWAQACEYSYPKVAAALRQIASVYDNDAQWYDQESAVQRRLGF